MKNAIIERSICLICVHGFIGPYTKFEYNRLNNNYFILIIIIIIGLFVQCMLVLACDKCGDLNYEWVGLHTNVIGGYYQRFEN